MSIRHTAPSIELELRDLDQPFNSIDPSPIERRDLNPSVEQFIVSWAESLTIAGWVAMWRSMEICLYDWWPIRRRRRLYGRLSRMPVDVVNGTGERSLARSWPVILVRRALLDPNPFQTGSFMPTSRSKTSRASRSGATKTNAMRYPENTVVGVIKTVKPLEAAVVALETRGFLVSEIQVLHGQEAAAALAKASGRRGFRGLAMRLVASIGMPNDETAIKNRYADALAKGWFLISVLTPTDERQKLASKILREYDAKFIHFFGRFTIETMHR